MTPEEEELIRRYIAADLDAAGINAAELLILINTDAGVMLGEALVARDRLAVRKISPGT